MIETNPQFGAGRVEPEKEKNPQPENLGGVKEDEEEVEDENNDYVDRSAFNEKLFARQFKPLNKRDIKMAEDRKSDQATYEKVCCVFFYGLPV